MKNRFIVNHFVAALLASTVFSTLLSSNALANNMINSAHIHKGHKVDFSAYESVMVSNDRIIMNFRAFAEGDTTQAVANKINRTMQSAERILNYYSDIDKQTSQYNIHPVYKKQTLSHWRGQQSLTLSLPNKPNLIKVLGQLQQHLAYQGMQFKVSKQRKQKILTKLQSQAIIKFRRQASQIAADFGAANFRILNTSIHSNDSPPVARPMYARAEMASLSADTTPSIMAGESQLKITVSGSILLPH